MSNTSLSLKDIREGISQIDEQLIDLLSKRRALSLEVAKYKVGIQKPIRDVEREQALLLSLIEKGGEKRARSAIYHQGVLRHHRRFCVVSTSLSANTCQP